MVALTVIVRAHDEYSVVIGACFHLVPSDTSLIFLIVQGTPLGVWEFRSKSSQDMCGLEGGCKGYMFALEVTEELETWPERENRDRRWVSVSWKLKFSYPKQSIVLRMFEYLGSSWGHS